MTQTAIEWLINELPTVNWDDPYYREKLKQAKEMEQNQIEEAFEEGHLTAHEHGCPASFVIPGSVYYDKLYTDIYKNE
jgi:hypothetical protein